MNYQNIDKQLIIIGGCRGVGKSALATEFCKQTNAEYLHPGDWFRQHLNTIDSRIIEGIAVHDLLCSETPVVDMHYSSYVKPQGFINSFCDDSLSLLANYFQEIHLYLVEVSPETLYERRLADTNKKRKLEPEIIREELRQNDIAFEHFVKILSQKTIVYAERVVNIDYNSALERLLLEHKVLSVQP